MRFVQDTSVAAYAVSVQCLKCGRMVRLAAAKADLDGPAFRAYYCTPTDDSHQRDCVPDTADN